jgi:hypothetical protein
MAAAANGKAAVEVNRGQIVIDPFSGPSVERLTRGARSRRRAPRQSITWSRSSETPRVRRWPLTAPALRHPVRLGCIVLSVETFWLTRIGHSHRCGSSELASVIDTERTEPIAQAAEVCPTDAVESEVGCVGRRNTVALRPTVLSRKAAPIVWLPSPRFGARCTT